MCMGICVHTHIGMYTFQKDVRLVKMMAIYKYKMYIHLITHSMYICICYMRHKNLYSTYIKYINIYIYLKPIQKNRFIVSGLESIY